MLCSDLGETLTSISHGLRDSSSNTSKPNNSWQQYRRRTFPTIMLFMLPSALQRTSYTVSSRANKVSVNKVIISAEDVRTWEQFWWQGQWSCSRLSWYRCPACPGVPTAFSATWPATQISTHTYVTADILLLILLIGHAVLSRNDLKMNLSVTHVMCNCSSKFEHCMVFCFWVNGRHKTDGLMKA